MSKKKILFVHGGTLEKAGTESYMMSVYHNIDKEKYSIDFLVFGNKEGYYDKEIEANGNTIYRLPMSLGEIVSKDSYFKIKREIKDAKYDIVHSHMNALNYPILKLMQNLEIPVRISHSHGSRHFVTSAPIIAFKEKIKVRIPEVSNGLLSCSKVAGEFLYGDNPYTIINNGIDVDAYSYNETIRDNLRKELNVENKHVYGHVGRLNFQKNHSFLIDTFSYITKEDPDAVLLLVGEGELLPNLQKQVENLNIQDKVYFLGIREDVKDVLQAMDYFIMPSIFEGLPYVLVEAQASGLTCFAADTIDAQSKLIDNFYFLPLDSPEKWANFILEHRDYIRTNTSAVIKELGFDEKVNVDYLTSIYDKLTEKYPNQL